jgi:Protein of unknown function (DUF2490)
MAAVGRTCILLTIIQFAGSWARAETIHDVRAWMSLTGQGPMVRGSRWRWYFDVQNRDRNSARDIDQFVVRPGVGYALANHLSFWGGYAYTTNFTAAGKVYENRIWEQLVFTPAALSTVSLRTRLEQRFFNGVDRTGLRLREQVRFTHPIGAKPSLSAIASDEVLFHMNTTGTFRRGFDQNRAFGGIGIKLNSKLRIDVGYLNQFVHSLPLNRMNHALSGIVNLAF